MTEKTRFSAEALGWQRAPGPLKVWKIVEGQKKTAEGETLKFSIQEIPEDRHEEILEHMCTFFARDEVLCSYTRAIADPVVIADFRKLWTFPLQQGTVVGAFVVDEKNPKPRLAGVNMTLVMCDAAEKGVKGIEFKSDTAKKIMRFMSGLEHENDTRKVYNVDKYIAAFGLSVDPEFRGQGIGYHLLMARDEMSVAYDITATSTVFTAVPAQKVAAKADFELIIERNYVDAKNEDGTDTFPGIPQKSCKLMGKTFSHAKKVNGVH